jgi:hypothetical protein
LLNAPAQIRDTLVLQGFEQIVGQDIGVMIGDEPSRVLGVHGLDARLHDGVDLGLDFGRGAHRHATTTPPPWRRSSPQAC